MGTNQSEVCVGVYKNVHMYAIHTTQYDAVHTTYSVYIVIGPNEIKAIE